MFWGCFESLIEFLKFFCFGENLRLTDWSKRRTVNKRLSERRQIWIFVWFCGFPVRKKIENIKKLLRFASVKPLPLMEVQKKFFRQAAMKNSQTVQILAKSNIFEQNEWRLWFLNCILRGAAVFVFVFVNRFLFRYNGPSNDPAHSSIPEFLFNFAWPEFRKRRKMQIEFSSSIFSRGTCKLCHQWKLYPWIEVYFGDGCWRGLWRCKGPSTHQTRIEWTNCHAFQWLKQRHCQNSANGARSHRTPEHIYTQALWCCLQAVWTLALTTVCSSICVRQCAPSCVNWAFGSMVNWLESLPQLSGTCAFLCRLIFGGLILNLNLTSTSCYTWACGDAEMKTETYLPGTGVKCLNGLWLRPPPRFAQKWGSQGLRPEQPC